MWKKSKINYGGDTMSKLKSRKLAMAVVAALLVIANEGLGLDLPTESVMSVAGIVMAYIFGQSYVDAKEKGDQ